MIQTSIAPRIQCIDLVNVILLTGQAQALCVHPCGQTLFIQLSLRWVLYVAAS
jgi:hypothetical protein